MDNLKLFQQIITGDFNNKAQVNTEVADGKQIHPLAKHVNRVFDDKIIGLPRNAESSNFWILEESYYTYPGKEMEIKPYLFNFAAQNSNEILLTVYQIPKQWKKEDCRNNNPDFKLNFNELIPSPTFKGALYTYNPNDKAFYTNSINELGNGIKFTLTEKMTTTQLVVMELLEKDGKRLTAYDTPIIYDRVK